MNDELDPTGQAYVYLVLEYLNHRVGIDYYCCRTCPKSVCMYHVCACSMQYAVKNARNTTGTNSVGIVVCRWAATRALEMPTLLVR